ncbi:GNAT family protein [Rurimicrobium arvi]|uniref:GNAT family protein n=1 Tax=Rurimicrobium arvi TaxID=2049916 RepID=A0ABP8MNS6_9BACT
MTQLLTTERMHLRVFEKEAYYALVNSHSDEELMVLLGFDEPSQLELEKRKVREGMCTYRTSVSIFHMLHKDSGAFIGSMAFHNWYPEHRRAEIGYITRPEWRRQGLMREALATTIPYGFEVLNLNRMEAVIAPYNIASQALVKAWNFRQEGHMKEHYMVNGQLEDSLLFALTRSEYDQLLLNKAQS